MLNFFTNSISTSLTLMVGPVVILTLISVLLLSVMLLGIPPLSVYPSLAK